jgi:hypothetical protein
MNESRDQRATGWAVLGLAGFALDEGLGQDTP